MFYPTIYILFLGIFRVSYIQVLRDFFHQQHGSTGDLYGIIQGLADALMLEDLENKCHPDTYRKFAISELAQFLLENAGVKRQHANSC